MFNNDTFILKTTIRSAAYEKLPIQNQEVGHSDKKLAIEQQEVGHSDKKLAIEQQEIGHSDKKLAIEQQEIGHLNKTLPIELIALADILKLCDEKHYNQATIKNIVTIYNDIEINQIFGPGYICKILACARSTGKYLMSKLREMDVVVPIKGKGKGQYRFKYKTEM